MSNTREEKENYTVIGAGSYGAVIKPALSNTIEGKITSFPGNVTKLFFRERNLNSTMKKIRQLPEIMGENKGHRADRYTRTYKGSNLPESLITQLKEKIHINPTDNLYLMRLPDLGKDATKIKEVETEFRNRNFLHVLSQIRKLIHQTAKLASVGYAHMDIRPPNVMLTPTTGDITIVDFDWLKSYRELFMTYPFGFYSNPPESLFIEEMENDGVIPSWIVWNSAQFEKTWNVRGVKYNEDGTLNKKQIVDLVLEANSENYRYLQSVDYVHTPDNASLFFLPYIDNYGLAMTLQEILYHIYFSPTNIKPEEYPIHKDALGRLLKNEDRDYTSKELDTIISTLAALYPLLDRMSSLRMVNRPTPIEAAAIIDDIYETAVRGFSSTNTNIGARAGAGGPAVGGRRKRHKTRRHRKARKATRRNL